MPRPSKMIIPQDSASTFNCNSPNQWWHHRRRAFPPLHWWDRPVTSTCWKKVGSSMDHLELTPTTLGNVTTTFFINCWRHQRPSNRPFGMDWSGRHRMIFCTRVARRQKIIKIINPIWLKDVPMPNGSHKPSRRYIRLGLWRINFKCYFNPFASYCNWEILYLPLMSMIRKAPCSWPRMNCTSWRNWWEYRRIRCRWLQRPWRIEPSRLEMKWSGPRSRPSGPKMPVTHWLRRFTTPPLHGWSNKSIERPARRPTTVVRRPPPLTLVPLDCWIYLGLNRLNKMVLNSFALTMPTRCYNKSLPRISLQRSCRNMKWKVSH